LVVARAYPTAEVGVAATVWGVTLFLAGAGSLGLPYGIIRFLPSERDRRRLLKAAFLLSCSASALLGVLFLAGLDVWAPALKFLRTDPLLAAVSIASVAGLGTSSVLDAAFVATRRAGYGTIRTVLFGVLRLPIPIFLAGLGILGIVLAWSVALGVSLVIGMLLLWPGGDPGSPSPSVEVIHGKGVLGYSLWNHSAAIIAAVPMSLLPLVILSTPAPQGGAEASAFFFAAAAIAGVLYVVPASFTTSLFVEGSHPEASYARDTRHAVGFSLALLAVGILAALVLGRLLLAFFGASYAAAGYEALVLLALASPVILANAVFTTHLRVDKRISPILWIVAASSVATILLALVLLPIWGILGAAVAYVLGQVVSVPLFAIERRRNGRRTGDHAVT
jgi:O-antigen/teichoic acid export membrane protein